MTGTIIITIKNVEDCCFINNSTIKNMSRELKEAFEEENWLEGADIQVSIT